MSTSLKVRNISTYKHESAEFAALLLYFSGKNNARHLVYIALNCEIYLVKGLRANLLISNNILSLEGVVIDIGKRSILIGSCGVTIAINVKQQGQFLIKRVLADQKTVVPPHSQAMVVLHRVPLPDNRDFLFYPIIQPNLTLYTHIIDYETSKVFVKNPFDRP